MFTRKDDYTLTNLRRFYAPLLLFWSRYAPPSRYRAPQIKKKIKNPNPQIFRFFLSRKKFVENPRLDLTFSFRLMASAARGDSSNPYYGGGLGAGGKFRKPPARRSQKTPYDRPPTSAKNPRNGIGEDRGWLSKLVDPAQRVITYSAHRLFASVFRKHLVSGETPLQSPEQKQFPERGKGLVYFFCLITVSSGSSDF